MQTSSLEQQQKIYTVSRLNNEVRLLLEENFLSLWIEGEISNFAAPHSGHWYFSLKDSGAQVRCAMFRMHNRKLNFSAKDGMHVLLKARVSLYENRGDFQLIAEEMEEQGEGKLRRAFEALKIKLEAAGLFAPEHKKTLPTFPQQIGVITSPTGAAIRDILTVLKRRFPSIPVVIYPTLVQGELAASQLVNVLQTANRRQECDILILARGGGSLEDLWPFNEEIVAHAIHQSEIPVISGVGHEIDFTIADFVADVRAPTPSAAAEISTPDQAELLQLIARNQQRLQHRMQQKLDTAKQHISWTSKHLLQQHPKRRLLEKIQRLDFYELTLMQLQQRLLLKFQNQLKNLLTILTTRTPLSVIQNREATLQLNEQKINNCMMMQLSIKQNSLVNVAAKLDALSPLGTLKRGYAITTHTLDNRVLRDAHQVSIGDKIKVRLEHGQLACNVETILE